MTPQILVISGYLIVELGSGSFYSEAALIEQILQPEENLQIPVTVGTSSVHIFQGLNQGDFLFPITYNVYLHPEETFNIAYTVGSHAIYAFSGNSACSVSGPVLF